MAKKTLDRGKKALRDYDKPIVRPDPIRELLAGDKRIALMLVKRELAMRSLAEFVKQYWRIVEPSTPLAWGWVLEALCLHLESVSRGEIKRLLINVPPGFMKSLLVNVFWPAWEWANGNHHLRYLCISYSQDLTIRDNRRFLRLVTSKEYQANWPVKLEQESVINVENNKTGWKLAGSISAGVTGKRANRVVIDDANNVAESESKAILESTNLWLREVMPDRLNNMEEDAIVNIQQRTNESDATATLLDTGVYEHLCIPMYYDPQRHCTTSIGWSDPRYEPGELAFPERFPLHVCEQLKVIKGSYAWAGQYQQAPAPRGGGIIKNAWWQLWPPEDYVMLEDGKVLFPDFEYIVASCDTAYTALESNDASACVVLGVWRKAGIAKVMLVSAWNERLEFNDLLNKIVATCRRRHVDTLVIEGKASGKSIIQEVKRLCRPEEFNVREVQPEGDKTARVHSIVALMEAGCVYAPDRQWAQEVIDQCGSFPNAKHDDLVDAFVNGLRFLRKQGILTMPAEGERNILDSQMFISNNNSDPLYDV